MADNSNVRAPSAAVRGMGESWAMIDALVGGTPAMRRSGALFLPQWPKESAESYRARLTASTLFPAFTRTAKINAAKPFARPINFGKIPARTEELFDDIDNLGTDLHPFAGQIMLNCLQYGLHGVLVDYPQAEGIRTIADEKAANARPYLTQYPATSILGWREQRAGKSSILTQLRLLENVILPDGAFGEKLIEQVRVLSIGSWQIWRKLEAATASATVGEWALFDEGTTSLGKIPFVFFYGVRKAFGVGESPLLDLAYMNVEHYQSSSDQQNILHVARVPILFAKGFREGDNLVIGSSTAATTDNTDADLSYVEHSGAAIGAGRQSVLDLEDRMRQAGAELVVQRASKSTATQVVSEGEGSKSALQQICEDFEESLEECLRLLGEWVGETGEVELELFKDFGAANLSDSAGDLLLRAADSGHISSETVFNQFQRMDIVSPEETWKAETARIATQPKPEIVKTEAPAPQIQ